MEENQGRVSRSSPRKMEANRRNSLLSTGPKSTQGKRHSRQNALKHGILSSALLIKSGQSAEDAGEFDELVAALHRDLVPAGQLEEMMVERIAVCWWRQRRAIKCERELIRKASDDPMRKVDHIFRLGTVAEDSDQSMSLPLGTDLERILHYETTVQRQLIFSMRELERLQRIRQGELLRVPLQIQASNNS